MAKQTKISSTVWRNSNEVLPAEGYNHWVLIIVAGQDKEDAALARVHNGSWITENDVRISVDDLVFWRELPENVQVLDSWIPLSDRWPDDPGIMWLTVLNKQTGQREVRVLEFAIEHNRYGYFRDRNSVPLALGDYELLAWRTMPQKPAPYESAT